MIPLTGEEIYGNWASLLLPFKKDQTIDFGCLENEISILIESQVNGIYSNGTAGEFYNITEDEFDKINSILAEKCNKALMPFQVGVSHMSPIISLNRLKRTLSLQPSAVQVILPDWFKVTNEEALIFLNKMSEIAEDIGLVLYNPPHAKRKLDPKDFGLLYKKVTNIVGVKVVGGDENWYAQMKKLCPNLSVFIPGHHMVSGCLNGAKGSYSNIACLNPVAAQKLYESIKEDFSGALEVEKRINIFFSEHILPLTKKKSYSNQAVDKFLAVIGGWSDIDTHLRWPYKSIEMDAAYQLRPIARDIIPEFCDF